MWIGVWLMMNENFTKTTKTKKPNLVKVNKNKDDKIVIRIDTKLKEQFTEYVENKGATVSDYVRQMIVQELSKESTKIYIKPIKNIKNIKSEIINTEVDISKDVQFLKEKMIELEYRINARLNENKE